MSTKLSRELSALITTGNPWRGMWRLSWPMLAMMVLHFFVGFTDVYVAGLIGTDVQAAVGFISQLFFLFIIVANAISIGTVSMVSRAIGAGEPARAVWNAKQSLLFGALMSTVLSAIVFAFHREIVTLVGFPRDIQAIAATFLKIFSLAIIPNYLIIISNAIFRAGGDVMKPLVTMLVFAVVNIAGDFALVFGIGPFPEMGFMGIAVATTLASMLGMCVNLFFFIRHQWKEFSATAWMISLPTVKNIIHVSWPAALLQIAWNAGSIVLYNILGRLSTGSVTALAALTNGLRIEAIIFLPPFALNMAASVLVGQNLGAGKPDRAEKMGWTVAGVGVAFVTVMALLIFIYAREFASLLTSDPAVLEETARYLRINMAAEPFLALGMVLSGGLQGAGDTRGTMWVIITAMWLIRLPLAYYFVIVAGLGATGAWIAMVSSMIVQGLVMARRFQGGYWKTIHVG
jgi:putative MATE family efflux protein